jgi:hypothetical protein
MIYRTGGWTLGEFPSGRRWRARMIADGFPRYFVRQIAAVRRRFARALPRRFAAPTRRELRGVRLD